MLNVKAKSIQNLQIFLQKLENLLIEMELKRIMPRVIHFEIPAENTEPAVNFCSKAFGWKIVKYGSTNYWLVAAGEGTESEINGAVAEKDETHLTTINTVGLPLYDEVLKEIKEASGQVLTSIMTEPNVGYMAYCKDTKGNIFGIMQTDPNAK
jgi:predicted enzyme related to lactoylglutathione lyase